MMKFLCVVGLCLLASIIHAQKAFKGGIAFGPVTTQISGDGLGGWDKFGMTAGAWINAPITEKSGITLEMKFINKGSQTKHDTLNFNKFAYRLNYIDVPVLFTYTRRPADKAKMTYSIGPYFGVLLSQSEYVNKVKRDIPAPQFLNYDIGAEIGAAYWLTENFFMKLTATSSVLPTRPNPSQVNKGSYYEKGNYNNTLQFTLGIRFGGKSES